MITSLSFFIILFFLDVSVRAELIAPVEEGISSYCEKSRTDSFWYVPTPTECCDHRGSCKMYIRPNEIKYGLKNTDPKYLRRHCDCDQRLYECVTEPMEKTYRNKVLRDLGFGPEICFRESLRSVDGQILPQRYEFVVFLDVAKDPNE